MAKHLFVISTPYQLTTAINIKENLLKDDFGVIYILDHFTNYESVFNLVKKNKVFNKAKLLKVKEYNNRNKNKNKIVRFVSKRFNLTTYKPNKFVNDDTLYDKVWLSFMDESTWIIYNRLKKKNNQLKINLFEDGTGTYSMLSIFKTYKHYKLLNFILKTPDFFSEITKMYVYEPKLVSNKYYKHIEISKLPKLINKTIINKILDCFKYKKDEVELLYEKKFIFLESPFQYQTLLNDQIKLIDFFKKKLSQDFIIKTHPRMFENKINDRYYTKVKQSLELVYMIRPLSNNVLISIYSTACLAPKLMFDDEPTVIFLYKLVNMKQYSLYSKSYLYDFITDFKNTYSKPERVFIPSSIEELEKIINRINIF